MERPPRPRSTRAGKGALALLLRGLGALLALSPLSPLGAGPLPHFVDLAREAGLSWRNTSGSALKHYIVETQSAGVGFWDYDLDGDLDLYFTSGSGQLGAEESHPGAGNALYRNEGDGTFKDITPRAGVGAGGWSMGCTMADYDGDGDPDLYVTRWGANLLYRNEGDGSFSDATRHAGVGHPGWGIGCAFADYDGDGDLDLYVANYIDFRLEVHGPPHSERWCTHNGIPAACGPVGFAPQPDVLYRNEGDGSFSDATRQAGMGARAFYGMGATWADLDGDGDQDLYVANDGQPNSLFRNDGGHFANIALLSGVAYSGTGRPQAGMGVAVGDYDNDGRFDLFVTNFSQDHNTLYRNEGRGFFSDLSGRAGLSAPSRPFMGWGTFFFDCDDDGRLDLFVANGHLMPAIDRAGVGLRYRQRNQLFRNRGDGSFAEISAAAGPGLQVEKVSRGAAFGDYDNDGDLDVVVANLDETPTLLRNEGGSRHYLSLRLRGRTGRGEAIGARVKVVSDSLVQYRQVQSGSSFQAQNELRLHFGLGRRTRADLVEVRWPGGAIQRFHQVPAGREFTIEEDKTALLE